MGRTMRRLVLLLTLLAAVSYPGASPASPSTTQESIEGAWEARTYLLADGSRHPVRGSIFFHSGRWQVLFFVMDAMGAARRGSGEGGTYELAGDRLTFHHELNLSVGEPMAGLPEAPLRMTARPPQEAVPEAARVAVRGDALSLFFPSGNQLDFVRAATTSDRP